MGFKRLLRGFLLLLPFTAGALPPETDLPYSGSATILLGKTQLQLRGTRILQANGQSLAENLYTAPVWDTRHLCVADLGAGLGQLRCWNQDLRAVQLADGGRPGRLALSGTHLAWVASPAGLPQVFVATVDGGQPRALTNSNLLYVPGHRPEGFVEPPLGDSLHFDGDWLRWTAPSGPGAVKWR